MIAMKWDHTVPPFNIHVASPLLYAIFVEFLKRFVKPCPTSTTMKSIRKIHNIFLSILSLFMLLTILYANHQQNKIWPLRNLLCDSYENNRLARTSSDVFMWSKYLEWGDTLFLVLSGRPISWLQYTHHMTTALLSYINVYPLMAPYLMVFQGMNCFVHVPMYWYFAYPKGALFKLRKLITGAQIVQHISAVTTSFATLFFMDDCDQNWLGNVGCVFGYGMYLAFFLIFYAAKYGQPAKKEEGAKRKKKQ